jgi:hypothetical protein
MAVPADTLCGGLDYVTGHVDESGTVTVVDVGRDHIHEAPLLITTYDADTYPEDGPFADLVFPPEYLAHSFSPEENVRLLYVHEPDPEPDEVVGEWSSVDFAVDRRLREQFRTQTEWYDHDDEAVELLNELLASDGRGLDVRND